MFPLSSFSNMIINSASCWVGCWWSVGCQVVGGQVYFVILILIFSILTIKKRQISSTEAVTIPKDILYNISIYYII